ncbi:MAG: ABC transporter permease [Bacillota bacterium]|nr:ABC transporter permease [Bacillota bacterium]
MVINKKITRTMLENKSQYLGALFLIIFSCLLYTMFNLLSSNMSTLVNSFEENYSQEDASFISDKKLNNLNAIESRFNMKIEEAGSIDYPVSKDTTLRIFSENTKVNIPAIIEGTKLSSNDILIDPAYAKANKLKVGGIVTLYNKDFKIAGFMSLPNYIYPLKSDTDLMNDPKSFGIAVIRSADFNALNNGNVFYSIRFNDSSNLDNKILQLKDYLKSKNLIILQWSNISENPRVSFVTAKLDSINKVSSSMPIAILLLTCILTGIVMWRMLQREAVIIGTMYALGYKRKEIMKHYLTYSLSIAVIGGIVGTILGALTLRPMLNYMVSYFNMPIESVDFNAKYIILSIVLPTIFLTISGYLVINKALKSSPLELMRGGKDNHKVSFIERHVKLDRFKFSTKFRIREQLRSIPRSLFLLLGVSLATMLLLLGFASKSSIDFLMKDTYEATYQYQYQYNFNSLHTGTPTEGEAFSLSPFTLKSDSKISFSVNGITLDSKYIALKDKSGKKLSTDQVIITRPRADKLKIKPGDTITAINKLDSREYNITIDSIAETYVGESIYMPLSKFNSLLNLPKDSYMGLWSSIKLDIPQNKLLATASIDDFKKSFDTMTKPLQAYVGSIAFMSFIIGLIVIYVVTSLIIEENKDNISLMKVLGYRKREVYSLVLNSSAITVILGYIVGVPLLLGSMTALFNSVTKDMNISFPVRIDYIYLLLGFIIIYLTYEISKALSKKKVNKISMTDALKSRAE